jgi:purine operon repressor
MQKFKRKERVAAMMNILTGEPNKLFSYHYFMERFNAAKSTISEDVQSLKEVADMLDLGRVETVSGAAGGVRYFAEISKEKRNEFLKDFRLKLLQQERQLSGGFIYLNDLLFNPDYAETIGKIFATHFRETKADCLLTTETKGIPIALMTAKHLNIPLMILRRNIKISDGPTVNINYLSGSTNRIQTMSLAKKSLKENTRVLIIDDFMRAGGTAKGMVDMVQEFNSEVCGMGILISTELPEKKLVDNFSTLLTLVTDKSEKLGINLIVND